MTSIVFPPYGEFARFYKRSVNPAALAPVAWRPGLPEVERETTWLEWRGETLAILNRTLWPLWDYATAQWVNPNVAQMLALTNADFVLLDKLNAMAALALKPNSPVASPDIPTHHQYFLDEDSNKLAERYAAYDVTLPANQLDKVITDLRAALTSKAGSVSIQFKYNLQRPRAYQVAKLLGREHDFELATTSMTSSMSSGHCFQGCLVSAGVYEAWLSRGFSPTASQLAALGQFGVDIGDRRVFAGVHYPSDNLSSWIMDLRLIGEVCPDRRVGAFLANSIVGQSLVFKLIKASGLAEYKPALDEVETLAASLVKA